MRIVIENGTISVVNTVDGSGVKVIQCVDPQGNVIILPLLPDAARDIGKKLMASVLAANAPLPTRTRDPLGGAGDGSNGGLAH